MSFVPDEDQRELVASVRRFLGDCSSSAQVRRLAETPDGFDEAVWRVLAGQLGLIGLAVPEGLGGQGFGFVEQALVFEETGRVLLCGPYFATVALAVPAILAMGDEVAARELLPGIVAGATRATLAVSEAEGSWEWDRVGLRAVAAAGGWTLTGSKEFVIDGHSADLLLVVARTARGLSLFAVDSSAAGLVREPMVTLDATRKQGRVQLRDTPGRLVGPEGGAGPLLARALDHALVALAMEQVGAAQRCLDMSVEYAKLRTQFGRKIGSFQAIKHKCADMLIALESARSTAYHAAWVSNAAPEELPVAAAMAKAAAGEAFTFVAAETVQVHGGIGFTWEHDAHLYFRRAYSSAVLLGDAAYHRERLATLLSL